MQYGIFLKHTICKNRIWAISCTEYRQQIPLISRLLKFKKNMVLKSCLTPKGQKNKSALSIWTQNLTIGQQSYQLNDNEWFCLLFLQLSAKHDGSLNYCKWLFWNTVTSWFSFCTSFPTNLACNIVHHVKSCCVDVKLMHMKFHRSSISGSNVSSFFGTIQTRPFLFQAPLWGKWIFCSSGICTWI